jgi:exopolysaccharide production protein ExoZ
VSFSDGGNFFGRVILGSIKFHLVIIGSHVRLEFSKPGCGCPPKLFIPKPFSGVSVLVNMPKIKPLQDLRGIAILMVVLYHSGSHLTDLVSHGNNGILLFFMISGFIITSAHDKDRGIGDFWVFMRKRVSRIHFPYIPVALLFIVMFLISGKGAEYHHDPVNIIRNLLLIQDPNESIHPYSWTLVFEMFYYLCFGVLFILLRKGVLPFALALALPPIVYFLNGGEDTRNLITSFYNLYFLFGVLLAYAIKKYNFRAPISLVVVLFLVFLVFPFLTNSQPLILLSTITFFYAYINLDINIKVLEKIGDASYTIYLSHAVILTLGKYVINDELLRFVVLFTLSIVFGYLYFLLTEKKLTNIGRTLLCLNYRGGNTNKLLHRIKPR